MTYRLTTIERDAAGNVHRIQRPFFTTDRLGFLVTIAKRHGIMPGRQFTEGMTIIAVEFTSEDAVC